MSGERKRASESELVKLEQKVSQMDAERKAVLTSLGEELDAACRSLARNGEDKLQVFPVCRVLVFIRVVCDVHGHTGQNCCQHPYLHSQQSWLAVIHS